MFTLMPGIGAELKMSFVATSMRASDATRKKCDFIWIDNGSGHHLCRSFLLRMCPRIYMPFGQLYTSDLDRCILPYSRLSKRFHCTAANELWSPEDTFLVHVALSRILIPWHAWCVNSSVYVFSQGAHAIGSSFPTIINNFGCWIGGVSSNVVFSNCSLNSIQNGFHPIAF